MMSVVIKGTTPELKWVERDGGKWDEVVGVGCNSVAAVVNTENVAYYNS